VYTSNDGSDEETEIETGARGSVFSLTPDIFDSTFEDEPSTNIVVEGSMKDPPGTSTSVIDAETTTGLTTWKDVRVVPVATLILTNEFLSFPVASPSLGALRVMVLGTDQSSEEKITV